MVGLDFDKEECDIDSHLLTIHGGHTRYISFWFVFLFVHLELLGRNIACVPAYMIFILVIPKSGFVILGTFRFSRNYQIFGGRRLL